MVIAAIYFKDKDCAHVKVCQGMSNFDHIVINGDAVLKPQCSWADETDYIVSGREVSIKGAVRKQTISHYLNRESNEEMSFFNYHEAVKSFYNEEGEYKDLESEYMCRKFKSAYVPVYKAYYEYEDIPVAVQEGVLEIDRYCSCSGYLKSGPRRDKEDVLFLYKFNKFDFCCESVKRIMEDFGVQRLEEGERTGLKEWYRLNRKDGYKWLELCDDQYFIKNSDMFGGCDCNGYIYGSYDDVLKVEQEIFENLRKKIWKKLDGLRKMSVKRSVIDKLRSRVDSIFSDVSGNKLGKAELVGKLKELSLELKTL